MLEAVEPMPLLRALAEGADIALEAFIRQTVTDRGETYMGIRENGMAPLYREAGRKVLGQ